MHSHTSPTHWPSAPCIRQSCRQAIRSHAPPDDVLLVVVVVVDEAVVVEAVPADVEAPLVVADVDDVPVVVPDAVEACVPPAPPAPLCDEPPPASPVKVSDVAQQKREPLMRTAMNLQASLFMSLHWIRYLSASPSVRHILADCGRRPIGGKCADADRARRAYIRTMAEPHEMPAPSAHMSTVCPG